MLKPPCSVKMYVTICSSKIILTLPSLSFCHDSKQNKAARVTVLHFSYSYQHMH